jgi:hypothetical protein
MTRDEVTFYHFMVSLSFQDWKKLFIKYIFNPLYSPPSLEGGGKGVRLSRTPLHFGVHPLINALAGGETFVI